MRGGVLAVLVTTALAGCAREQQPNTSVDNHAPQTDSDLALVTLSGEARSVRVATPASHDATAAATIVWEALLRSPPDYATMRQELAREDAESFRLVKYAQPDKMQDTVLLGNLHISLAIRDHLGPALRGFFEYVRQDVTGRARALVGLDQLFAGIMISTPAVRLAMEDIALDRANPGFANTTAMSIRGLILNEMVRLGEPLTYYEPQKKRDVINTMVRAVGTNKPLPDVCVP